VQDSNLRSSRG